MMGMVALLMMMVTVMLMRMIKVGFVGGAAEAYLDNVWPRGTVMTLRVIDIMTMMVRTPIGACFMPMRT